MFLVWVRNDMRLTQSYIDNLRRNNACWQQLGRRNLGKSLDVLRYFLNLALLHFSSLVRYGLEGHNINYKHIDGRDRKSIDYAK